MTPCVASQQVFVVVYFVIDPVRTLLNTSSYIDVCSFGPFSDLDGTKCEYMVAIKLLE
jgi:hypothetical protein